MKKIKCLKKTMQIFGKNESYAVIIDMKANKRSK